MRIPRIITTLSAKKLRIVGQLSLFWHWSDKKRTACRLLYCIICHGDFLSKCVSNFLSLITAEHRSSLVFFCWKGAAVVSSLLWCILPSSNDSVDKIPRLSDMTGSSTLFSIILPIFFLTLIKHQTVARTGKNRPQQVDLVSKLADIFTSH